MLSALAASAATSYAHGMTPSPTVTAQAQLRSHAAAYWWAAAFFAFGFLLCTALYRSGAPKLDPDGAVAVPV